MLPVWKSALMTIGFLAIEIPFFLANLPKIKDGGWFPVVISFVFFSLMTTWKRGRTVAVRLMQSRLGSVKEFVKNLRESPPPRVRGTSVFMTPNPRVVPPALKHHYKHNQVLHEQVLLLAIVTEDVPMVPTRDILEVNAVGENIYELVAHYGFMQTPQVARILRLAKAQYGIYTDTDTTSFFLGRDILLTDGPEPMMTWRKKLFAYLVRNSVPATAYFGIPPDRVIEMGMQVKL
jgi:KUP system potassium uptake protein